MASQFRQHKGWKDGRDRWCIPCRQHHNKVKNLESSPRLGLVCWFEKACRVCEMVKPLSAFNKRPDTFDRRESICNSCKTKRSYYKNLDESRERARERMREMRADPVKYAEWKDRTRDYRVALKRKYRALKGCRSLAEFRAHQETAREKRERAKSLRIRKKSPTAGMTPAERARWKMANDPGYVVNQRMRVAIRKALMGGKDGRRWESLVGYTLAELQLTLERMLPKGWTLLKALEARWHIDHIIPKSTFNLADRNELRACWDLSNLRLVPAKVNLQKSANRIFLL